MSVGEWLNDVIEPEDGLDDEEPALFTDFYEEPEAEEQEESPRYSRRDTRMQHRAPNSRREGREERTRDADRKPAYTEIADEPQRHSRRADREPRRPADSRRETREERQRDVGHESAYTEIADELPRDSRRDDREPRRPADSRREKREELKRDFDHESVHTRGALNEVHSRLDRLSQQLEQMSRKEAAARQKLLRPRPPEPERRRDQPQPEADHYRPRSEYRPQPEPEYRPQPERNRDRRSSEQVRSRPITDETRSPSQDSADESPRLTGAPSRFRPSSKMAASIDDAVAEIAARQQALDSGERDVEFTARPAAREPEPAPLPAAPPVSAAPAPPAASTPPAPAPVSVPAFLSAPEPTIDLANLDQQLRHITERIEALRPSNELENAIKGIRTDLSDIAQLITGALPRRAVELLEIEVKALAERIDHSRQFGVDTTAIAGLDRGLNEIRDALRTLRPAESLVGFDDAVKELSQKVDLIAAKEDPAALQQLETAIGTLRGIVSHVASNETLTKVAEDVRALAAKVDTLASSAASNASLSALENRIETLANALTASADAGQAVPRELEKLLTGLIEKLEWVQLTHTDHAALAHLEDRIATLVQRFDASETRFGHLEAVERGIADLLVHIDDIKGLAGKTAAAALPPKFERDVAEIKQSEQRTQDSLEAVQGTVEQVVDRLAMIESGIRGTASRPAPAPSPVPMPPVAQLSVAPPPTSPATAAPFSPASTPASFTSAAAPSQFVPTPSTTAFASAAARAPIAPAPAADVDVADATSELRAAAARNPINPDLPPDHPLEPGSASNRPRTSYSAADRIAASEAAAGTVKPPVIADFERKAELYRCRSPCGAGCRGGTGEVGSQDKDQGQHHRHRGNGDKATVAKADRLRSRRFARHRLLPDRNPLL